MFVIGVLRTLLVNMSKMHQYFKPGFICDSSVKMFWCSANELHKPSQLCERVLQESSLFVLSLICEDNAFRDRFMYIKCIYVCHIHIRCRLFVAQEIFYTNIFVKYYKTLYSDLFREYWYNRSIVFTLSLIVIFMTVSFK